MEDRLDPILEAGVARGAVPGAVAVIVDPDGVLYEGAAGERELGSGIAMTTDTVGAIYSMTKPLTGAAVMQLVERGELCLDAPASEVCPELGDVVVLDGFDGGGRPVTRPPATPVTLRHLLTHTSGFAYDAWNADLLRWIDDWADFEPFARGPAMLHKTLVFDPGTRWEYGIGIDWAGRMVEVVSDMTIGQYLAEHVTGPLAMTDTAFTPTASMAERRAAMHRRASDGSLAATTFRPPSEPLFEHGGGGLYSTMGDYARFIRMILNDGELDGLRVLAAETVATMARNHIGDIRVCRLPSAAPHLSNDAEFFPGEPKSWGLTFQINETACSTGRPAGTLMWAGLSNCFFWIDRHNGLGGAFLSQVLPFADQPSVDLFLELEHAVYAARR